MPTTSNIELRGAVFIDQMQPQFAATVATNSDGFFPVTGEASFWLEVRPGIVINRLMDVALKACDVKPGALITERSYGTLEVHSSDQGQVRQAGALILKAAGLAASDGLAPNVMTSETIRKISDTQAMMINRSRAGMLVLGDDTLYTLEVNPAVYVVIAANEAGLGAQGAVGRLRLAGSDAEIDEAVKAVQRALSGIGGRPNTGID